MPEASSRWWTPAVLALALLRPEGASALAAFRRPHAFGAARAAYAGGGPAAVPCYRPPLSRRQRRRHQPPLFATAAANEGEFGDEEAEEDENVDYPSFRRRDDDPNAEYPSFRVERYLALTLSRSAQSARYGSSGGDGGGDGERGGERSGTTELIDSEQQDEEPYEEPSFRSDSYLGSLSRYADDGRSLLKAPQRYSSRQWRDNLASMSGDKVLRAVRGQLLWQCVWALFISLVYIIAGRLWAGAWGRGLPALPALPHSLLGGVLGVLLGFRTNQSYERFWEGRKLWGQCFAICRTLARSSLVYIDADTDTYARIIRNLKAFPVALKQHLRGEFEMAELAGTLETKEINELATADNLPLSVCTSLSITVNSIKLDETQSANNLLWWTLEDNISKLSTIISDCERLVRTPVPLAYSVHTSRLLSLWVGTLPFVLVGCFSGLRRLLTVPLTALVAWALFCTEELGHIIEEPFGAFADSTDEKSAARTEILPLNRYCESLQNDLEESNRIITSQRCRMEDNSRAQIEGREPGEPKGFEGYGNGKDEAYTEPKSAKEEMMQIAKDAVAVVEAVEAQQAAEARAQAGDDDAEAEEAAEAEAEAEEDEREQVDAPKKPSGIERLLGVVEPTAKAEAEAEAESEALEDADK